MVAMVDHYTPLRLDLVLTQKESKAALNERPAFFFVGAKYPAAFGGATMCSSRKKCNKRARKSAALTST